MRTGTWLVVGALFALALGACAPEPDDESLTVFAAASLRSVMEELEAAWLAEYPESPLTVATEASNVLAAQIAEGAPADVFLSADEARPQWLADEGLTAAQPTAFAANRITLVTPAGDDRLATPLEVAEPGVRLVGINDAVPIARYTRAAIAALSEGATDPDAFVADVEANVVSREDNVRAALAKVELGEGDAAFVYVTDAHGSRDVRELPLPAAVDVTARYAAVQVSDRTAAAEFIDWLGRPEALAVIEAAGFEAAL